MGGADEMCRKYDKKSANNHFSDCIILCSNAGIGFVISYVGVSAIKSLEYGVYLYFTQVLLSFLLNRAFSNTCKAEQVNEKITERNFVDSVVFSVKSAIKAITTICSFTVIFSLITKMLILTLGIGNNKTLTAFFASLLEISQGVSISSSLDNGLLKSFLIGFSVGFGGLCVILQIFSVCSGYPLNRLKFFFSKLAQGILCGIMSMLYFSSLSIDIKILSVIFLIAIILILGHIRKKFKFIVDFFRKSNYNIYSKISNFEKGDRIMDAGASTQPRGKRINSATWSIYSTK